MQCSSSRTRSSRTKTAPTPPHPIQFEALTRQVVLRAALNTHGAAGPSGVAADNWRRMCSGFADISDQLCDAIAASARRLATTYVHPSSLEAYVACRLIPLDKKPGVRPIGIGEVLRRIMGKAILSITNDEIQRAAGSLQLCAGQDGGVEAAIHAMNDLHQLDDTEAILLADATNAFNCLNREVCMRNIQHTCPSLAPTVINTYREPANLFVSGECIKSSEGTTQGDPVAMAMYALGVLPLIEEAATDGATQSWFADDSAAGGKLQAVRIWWDRLNESGPSYGYFLNPTKSVLLVKPQFLDEATSIFAGTGIDIRTDGCRHLGAALGSAEFSRCFMERKVQSWVEEVMSLSTIASSQPQAAYAAFVHGLRSKWSFLSRVMADLHLYMQPLEDSIRNKFIPALLGGRTVNDDERQLLALPCRHGGLGLITPASLGAQYAHSKTIVGPLVRRIQQQTATLGDALQEVRKNKQLLRAKAKTSLQAEAVALHSAAPPEVQRTIDLASERGASSWLTCRPLKAHGFTLTKAEFRDAVHLRYGWHPVRLPTSCSCGQQFTVSHALSCPLGGFPTLRHNEVRDVTARLAKRVGHQVAIEPHLQPLTGEQLRYRTAVGDDQARLDVVASGIWGGRFERTYIDVRVFNPFASSNRLNSLAASYTRHEKAKRRAYEQRIREVEHSSFVPAVFSTTGGMGKSATSLYKRIASLIADKTGEAYSAVMASIRCQISFALVRSSVMCLRGARRLYAPVFAADSAALVVAEAAIPC